MSNTSRKILADRKWWLCLCRAGRGGGGGGLKREGGEKEEEEDDLMFAKQSPVRVRKRKKRKRWRKNNKSFSLFFVLSNVALIQSSGFLFLGHSKLFFLSPFSLFVQS